MLALCSMRLGTYYAQNYASIIGGSLSMEPYKIINHINDIRIPYKQLILLSKVSQINPMGC